MLLHGGAWAIVFAIAGLISGGAPLEIALLGALPGFVFGALLGREVMEFFLSFLSS